MVLLQFMIPLIQPWSLLLHYYRATKQYIYLQKLNFLVHRKKKSHTNTHLLTITSAAAFIVIPGRRIASTQIKGDRSSVLAHTED